jgi:hypothetical protein
MGHDLSGSTALRRNAHAIDESIAKAILRAIRAHAGSGLWPIRRTPQLSPRYSQ